ncbi:electron transfer flavoprotein subunit alpha [bacterium]|nr:electron transfer flavoprotein subunit alpha [bacterium]
MGGLVIDQDACIGCGKCVRACASHGVEVVDRTARVTDGCTLCGTCVDACPVGAMRLERGDVAGAPADDLAGWRDVWVLAQADGGGVAPVSLELLGKAREIAGARGCRVVALVACAPADLGARVTADGLASALIAHGADEVVRCLDDRLAAHDAGLLAAWVRDLARRRRPEAILVGATALGREVAPHVAAGLGCGLTADCTALELDPASGLLRQTRPAFGGNLMVTIVCPRHRPQMATVRPGVLPCPAADPTRRGVVRDEPLAADARPAIRLLSRMTSRDDASIAGAERLVVVGRGIGAKRNVALARRLADLLDAGLGCTRPLVEAGWCGYAHQVGQTGVSVAPKVLVSVGVSGAIQHLAGIGGAQTVIAVNSDPEAPIFGVSTYAVVGDCLQVMREMVGLLERAPA